MKVSQVSKQEVAPSNPEEIQLDFDDKEIPVKKQKTEEQPAANPEEIPLDLD